MKRDPTDGFRATVARRAGSVLSLLLLLGGGASGEAQAAESDRWETRGLGGGEVGATRFGIFDVGLRKGPLSIQLFTDTLDVRLAPQLDHGRYFIGLRLETFAAGLMTSPWSSGAPDPSRALIAGYGGVDGGWLHYLPGSFYAGLQGSARIYLFWALPDTTTPAPGLTGLLTAEAVVGRYTATIQALLRAGIDAQRSTISPHVVLEVLGRPDWVVAPRIELRAAWAHGQDFLTRTRLGGLNPYVVPLAGAGWAEFWVESYAALRAGPTLKLRLPSPATTARSLELGLVADLASFDGGSAVGFAALGKLRSGRWSVEAAFGYAPWLLRQEGVARVSGLLLIGADWAARS